MDFILSIIPENIVNMVMRLVASSYLRPSVLPVSREGRKTVTFAVPHG